MDWSRAACAEAVRQRRTFTRRGREWTADADWWHPDRRATAVNAEARRICLDECPIREECLAFAMRIEETAPRVGILGGMYASEREAHAVDLRRQRLGVR